MNSLQDIIKTIQKQNEKTQNAYGLTTLQGLAHAISKQNEFQNNLTGIAGLTDIAKTISRQMKSFNTPSAILGSNIKAQINAMQYHTNYSALLGLTSTLSEIAKSNQLLSDKLSGFATSQIFLTNNLSEIAKSISQTHLSKFNSIDVALKGISNAYLKDIAIHRSWDDIKVAEEVNNTIIKVSDELLIENEQVTVKDLDNLKQTIVNDLYSLLAKTKTEKARQFLVDIIALISFLLTFYSVQHQKLQEQSDLSNHEVVQKIKSDIERINKEIPKQIEAELQKFNQTRIARTYVNLRYSNKKNSKIIGLVKKGQRVTVIETKHKFILVSYIDLETGEPKSGFAVKKYFENEK